MLRQLYAPCLNTTYRNTSVNVTIDDIVKLTFVTAHTTPIQQIADDITLWQGG